jgi:hypothetical protein
LKCHLIHELHVITYQKTAFFIGREQFGNQEKDECSPLEAVTKTMMKAKQAEKILVNCKLCGLVEWLTIFSHGPVRSQ